MTIDTNLYNSKRVCLTKRIEEEKTFAFKTRKEAEEKAKEIRSYVEELFSKNNKTGRFIPWGYGVPK